MSSWIGPPEQGEHSKSGATRRNRPSSSDEDAPGHKRQRTALACNSCRFRKSRCNGARPICATCNDLGFDCVYKGPVPTPRAQSREMQSMEKRMQKFEDLLRVIANKEQVSDNGDGPSVRFAAQPAASSPSRGSAAQDASISAMSRLDGFQQRQPRTQWGESGSGLLSVTQDDTVDGMGSIIFADESSSGFFGPSSNSSFFSNIARALVSGTGTMSDGRDFSRDLAGRMSRPPSPPPQRRGDRSPVNPYKLPSRTEMLRLIDVFFCFTGQFFPYLSKCHITQMVKDLDLVRLSGTRRSWLCLLNAILAMSTSLLGGGSGHQVKSREVESDIFFQRALILSPWTISNTANLEALQALTVMTQYLQGTSRSAQTWRLHGLLVQAAFQVGVHTKEINSRLPAFEQEVRTRTWYTCIILDRIFSTTFGRPPLIHNELIQIGLPLDIELEQLPKDDSNFQLPQSPDSGPLDLIFIPSIKLYIIQGDIIRDIYNQNIVSAHPLRLDELFSKIIHLDHGLTQWKNQLHPDSGLLPLDSIEDMDVENWAHTKVQTVLTLRFLNVRALLFRKVLEHSLDEIGNPSIHSNHMNCSLPVGETMIQACADSCIQTITIIRRIGARSELLPAWWYTAYYVFNSALILFGVICLQTLEETDVQTRPAAELVMYIQTGLEALDVVGKETRIVRRCSKYLRKIIQVSTLLVRNHASARQLAEDGTTFLNLLPNKAVPSISDESTQSPLQNEFGQFLVDENYSFLDAWSGLVQEPMMNLTNLESTPHRQR